MWIRNCLRSESSAQETGNAGSIGLGERGNNVVLGHYRRYWLGKGQRQA